MLGVLLAIFFAALIFVLVSIIKFKLHPFLALLLGGLLMGILAGMPLDKTAAAMAAGFGGTMQGIGIIIVLGVALGSLLHVSGCTSQIAALLLRVTGTQNTPMAIALTGYIVSIPVFFDAAFVILVNLVKTLSRQGRVPFATLVTALAVGLITTHAMVIPTPGPIAVAATMGVNIGWFLFYAIIASLAGVLVGGVLYGKYLGTREEYKNDFASAFDDELSEEEEREKSVETKKLPSGELGIFLIFFPIFIILLGTVAGMFLEKGTAAHMFFTFIGDKNIALLLGLFMGFACLRPYLTDSFNDLVNEACTQSGIILAITGAGGAFGKIINETGIGKQLVEGMTGLTDGTGALILVAAFIISQVLRAAQGSTTVALVTTAAIFAPVVTGLEGVSPLLAALAICAGGIGLSLPNDSGFWVINRFGKFDVPGTMRVWTVGGTISGVTALIVVLILSMFTGTLPGLL